MNFNPIFFQAPVNTEGLTDTGKIPKLNGKSYLFSDIIKVCIDKTAATDASPQSGSPLEMLFRVSPETTPVNLNSGASSEEGLKLNRVLNNTLNLLAGKNSGVKIPTVFPGTLQADSYTPEVTSDMTHNEVTSFISNLLSSTINNTQTGINTIGNLAETQVYSGSDLQEGQEYTVYYSPTENSIVITGGNNSTPDLNAAVLGAERISVKELFNKISTNFSTTKDSSIKQTPRTLYQVTVNQTKNTAEEQVYLDNFINTAMQSNIPLSINIAQANGNNIQVEVQKPETNVNNIVPESITALMPDNTNGALQQSAQQNFVNQKVINKVVNQNQSEPVATEQKIYNSNNNPFTAPETNNSNLKNYSTATVAKGKIDIITENASEMKMTGPVEQNVKKDALDKKGTTEQIGIPEATAVSSKDTVQVTTNKTEINQEDNIKEKTGIKTETKSGNPVVEKINIADEYVNKSLFEENRQGLYTIKISAGNKNNFNTLKITVPRNQYAQNKQSDYSTVIINSNAGNVPADFSFMAGQGVFSNEKVIFSIGMKTEIKADEAKVLSGKPENNNTTPLAAGQKESSAQLINPDILQAGKSEYTDNKNYSPNQTIGVTQQSESINKKEPDDVNLLGNNTKPEVKQPEITPSEIKPNKSAENFGSNVYKAKNILPGDEIKNYDSEKFVIKSDVKNIKSTTGSTFESAILTEDEINLLNKAEIVEVKQNINTTKNTRDFKENINVEKNPSGKISQKPPATTSEKIFTQINPAAEETVISSKPSEMAEGKPSLINAKGNPESGIKSDGPVLQKEPVATQEKNKVSFINNNTSENTNGILTGKDSVLNQAVSSDKTSGDVLLKGSETETSVELPNYTEENITDEINNYEPGLKADENNVSVQNDKNTLIDIKSPVPKNKDLNLKTEKVVSAGNEIKLPEDEKINYQPVTENNTGIKQEAVISETKIDNKQKPTLKAAAGQENAVVNNNSSQNIIKQEPNTNQPKSDIKITSNEIKNELPADKQFKEVLNFNDLKDNVVKTDDRTINKAVNDRPELLSKDNKSTEKIVSGESNAVIKSDNGEAEIINTKSETNIKSETITKSETNSKSEISSKKEDGVRQESGFKYTEIKAGDEGNQVIKINKPEKSAGTYKARTEEKAADKNSVVNQTSDAGIEEVKSPRYSVKSEENISSKNENVNSASVNNDVKAETVITKENKKPDVKQNAKTTDEKTMAAGSQLKQEPVRTGRPVIKEQKEFTFGKGENSNKLKSENDAEGKVKNSSYVKDGLNNQPHEPVIKADDNKFYRAGTLVKEVNVENKNEKNNKPREEIKSTSASVEEKSEKKEKTGNDLSGKKDESSRYENQETASHSQKSSVNQKSENQQSFHFEVKQTEQSNILKEKIPVEYTGHNENLYKTVKAPEVMKEITDFISRGETKSIVLKIDPENLGKVKIIVEMADKVVNANIEVENENVKRAVMNNLDNLKASLAQNGVQLNSVNVSLPGYEQKNPKQMQPRKRQFSEFNEEEIVEEARAQKSKTWGYNTYEYVI